MILKAGQMLTHIKRGTQYRVLGIGHVDMPREALVDEAELVPGEGDSLCALGAHPDWAIGVQCETHISESTVWVLYRALVPSDGTLPEFWLRPAEEFEGRFAVS